MFSQSIDQQIVEEARLRTQHWRAARPANEARPIASLADEVIQRLLPSPRERQLLWYVPLFCLVTVFAALGFGLVISVFTYGAIGLEGCARIAGFALFFAALGLLFALGVRFRDLFPFDLFFRL